MRHADVDQRAGRKAKERAKSLLICSADQRIGRQGTKGCGRGGREEGQKERSALTEAAAEEKRVGDDSFRKFVQDYARGREPRGELLASKLIE